MRRSGQNCTRKVEGPVEKSVQLGTWWFPESPDDRFCGVLWELDDGRFRLEYEVGIMDEEIDYLPLILGEADGHYYTRCSVV